MCGNIRSTAGELPMLFGFIISDIISSFAIAIVKFMRLQCNVKLGIVFV